MQRTLNNGPKSKNFKVLHKDGSFADLPMIMKPWQRRMEGT